MTFKESHNKSSVPFQFVKPACPFWFGGHLDGKERAGCFAWFVFMVSHGGCVVLPRGALGLSAVCDCGIS